jgi:hypothetical protein
MRDHYSQLQYMPIPVPPEKAKSAIESRFPHIARELGALWHTDQIELYLDSLLIDTRGGRQGFPAEVLDELMFLSGMRWHIRHETVMPMDLQKPDLFSFAAANESDIRRCGTTGAWVLT